MILENAEFIFEFLSKPNNDLKNFDTIIVLCDNDINILRLCKDLCVTNSIKKIILINGMITYNDSLDLSLFENELKDKKETIKIEIDESSYNFNESVFTLKERVKENNHIGIVCAPYQKQRCIETFQSYLPNCEFSVLAPEASFTDCLKYKKDVDLLRKEHVIQAIVDEVSYFLNGPAYGLCKEIFLPFEVIDSYNYLLIKDYKNLVNKKLLTSILERWETLGITEDITIKKEKRAEKEAIALE